MQVKIKNLTDLQWLEGQMSDWIKRGFPRIYDAHEHGGTATIKAYRETPGSGTTWTVSLKLIRISPEDVRVLAYALAPMTKHPSWLRNAVEDLETIHIFQDSDDRRMHRLQDGQLASFVRLTKGCYDASFTVHVRDLPYAVEAVKMVAPLISAEFSQKHSLLTPR